MELIILQEEDYSDDKKKSWIPYKRKAKSIEINVKDHHNQTIDQLKLEKGMTRDRKRILKKLKEEYDFDLIEPKKPNWLKKDMEW